jgi:predicted lipid-binding transport protein (Tim44 family)
MVAIDWADARAGGGRSVGSRGSRTFSTPPATNTAPKAAPVERSMTQKGSPTATQGAQSGANTATQASRFGGWRGILMGGLLAAAFAGIFGFGALASILGFLLQFALIAGLIYLAFAFFRSRSQPAVARGPAGASQNRSPLHDVMNSRAAAASGGDGAASPALTIGQTDLDSFERLLGEVQTAYSREDTSKLGAITTPEMLSYFAEQISDNAKRGLRNEVTDVKLLQGDISEAWRENGSDFATVAMRYSLVDVERDRATGRLVAGNENHPTEATEFWTFRRDDRARGEGWQLSAIQQAA